MRHYNSLITKIEGETKDKIDKLIELGYINRNIHPSGDLFIYNYSDKCQYDNAWDNETLQCRGLIADKKGHIIARPFPKFFNFDPEEGLNEPFVITEKFDGSLGIMYYYDGDLHIATRGSFDGPQAIKGTELLRQISFYNTWKQTNYYDEIILKQTHLFEIIYPENRVVVDYKDQETLQYLSTIEIDSGKEIDPMGIRNTLFDSNIDLIELKNTPKDNFEGYVITYESGIKRKIKLEEYVKLHALITDATPKRIWEMTMNREPFDELITKMPDELYKEIQKQREELLDNYDKIRKSAVDELQKFLPSRKELAEEFKKYAHPTLLFAMISGKSKDFEKYIWEYLKPKAEENEST